jgi:hypothetical protein
MPEERQLCSATRKDGTPCKALALADGFCAFHSPALAGRRQAGRKKGGAKSYRPPVTLGPDSPDFPLASVGDVCAFLAVVINKTARGGLDPKIANALTYAASTLSSCLARGDLETRLAAVEQLLAQPKGGAA